MEPTGAAPSKEVSQGSMIAMPSHMEAIKQFVSKSGFCKEVAEVVATEVMKSTLYPYQGKWSKFLHCCLGRDIATCMTTVFADNSALSLSAQGLEVLNACIKGLEGSLQSSFCPSRYRSGC